MCGMNWRMISLVYEVKLSKDVQGDAVKDSQGDKDVAQFDALE